MTKLNQIWKCEICGNIIEMVHEGADSLVCCGQPMQLQKEKITDEGSEKHVPVVEQTDNKIKVIVGSVEHPMEQEHFIEWIEVTNNRKTYRKFLKPGDKPEAEFCIDGEVSARSYCNVHGLWKSR